jgi:hypothetical protein
MSDVPLNEAQKDREAAEKKESGNIRATDTKDLLELQDIVDLGWISPVDIADYYSEGGKKQPPALKKKFEKIVIMGPRIIDEVEQVEPSSKLKAAWGGRFRAADLKATKRHYNNNPEIIDWKKVEDVKEYFDKLDKKEKGKTSVKELSQQLKDLGFGSSKVGTSKSLMGVLGTEMSKDLKKIKDTRDRDLNYEPQDTKRNQEMWIKTKNAENYNNESYLKRQERFKNYKKAYKNTSVVPSYIDNPIIFDPKTNAIEFVNERIFKNISSNNRELPLRTKELDFSSRVTRPHTKFLYRITPDKVTKKVSKKGKEVDRNVSSRKGKEVLRIVPLSAKMNSLTLNSFTSPKSPKSPKSSRSSSNSTNSNNSSNSSRPSSYMSVDKSPGASSAGSKRSRPSSTRSNRSSKSSNMSVDGYASA